MIVKDLHVDLETPTGIMRAYVCEPADETIYQQRRWGGLVFYSEIFQITTR